jgi:hypothetical protein
MGNYVNYKLRMLFSFICTQPCNSCTRRQPRKKSSADQPTESSHQSQPTHMGPHEMPGGVGKEARKERVEDWLVGPDRKRGPPAGPARVPPGSLRAAPRRPPPVATSPRLPLPTLPASPPRLPPPFSASPEPQPTRARRRLQKLPKSSSPSRVFLLPHTFLLSSRFCAAGGAAI